MHCASCSYEDNSREYTFQQKGNKRASHLVILESDPSKTRFNYYLVRRKQRKFLKDIKVLPSEDCITQHRPLVFGNVRKVKDTRKMFVPGRKI